MAFIVLVCVAWQTSSAQAQQSDPTSPQNASLKIFGQVMDAKTNLPIIGASIWVKDSTVGTSSDIDGNFSFTYPGSYAVINISYVGYKTIEIPVTGKAIKAALESNDALEEVVVVAYGTQKKASIVGSIATVAVDDLKMPTAKISSTLMGNLSGVVATNRSGEPGAGSSFWIRGISTFGANASPLVLVDGIERDLDLVDVDDIRDFSILKDAAATAIYGVRGANGVILVTTRSGEEGKPRITLKVESGILQPTKVPMMVNSSQFAQMYNEAVGYEKYGPEAIKAYRTGSDPDLYPNIDWLGRLYKDHSWNQRVNLNVSGGSSIVKYYISGGFYNENGMFATDNMKNYDTSVYFRRYNFRSNVDVKLFKYTTLNVNLTTTFERKNEPGTSGGDIWRAAYRTSPNAYPLYYSNGQLAGDGQTSNPYTLLTQTGYKEYFYTTAQSLFGLTQDFSEYVTKGLTANIKFSFDANNSVRQNRTHTPPQFLAYGRDPNGELLTTQKVTGTEHLGYSELSTGYRSVYLEGSINYLRDFGRHSVGALFLYQQSQRNELDSGRNNSSDSSEKALPYRHQGIAGRITYDFDDRYFIEGNFGYNGSENFAPGHRFGFFPSVAAGWMVSNEKFFEPLIDVVDVLKFKGSYGKVGNDIIGGDRRFIYLATIGTSYNYVWGTNLQSTTGSSVGHWANEHVGWEESVKLNLGFDISFFNRLKISMDYFHEERSGIFLQRKTIPYYTGIGQTYMPYVNVGRMENWGYDASLEYRQRIGEVDLMARGNFTFARNKILHMDEPHNDWAYQNETGQARYQRMGYVALGLFKDQEDIDTSPSQELGSTPRPGDIKYLDLNNDGVVDKFDQKPLGYTDIPEIAYGFGFSARWKGIDLSVLFQGATHVNFFINSQHTTAFTSNFVEDSSIFSDVWGNYWTEQNPNPRAKYPRLSEPGNNGNNSVRSSFWMVDGSYLRLKSAELGYTLPSSLTRKVGIENLRIYLSGINLLTFSPFKLWDPELNTGDGSALYSYPNNRTISLGINIGF